MLARGAPGPLSATFARPYALARLAEALVRLGKHGAAVAAVREGLQAQEQTGQRWYESEFHRLDGVALIGLNRIALAREASTSGDRVAAENLCGRIAATASSAALAGHLGLACISIRAAAAVERDTPARQCTSR